MSTFDRKPSLAFLMCLLVVLSTLISVQPVLGDTSRAPATFVWSPHLQLTNSSGGDHVGQTGLDSTGNLHCVWVNYTGTIYYGKTDLNGTFLVNPKALGISNRGWDANPRLSVDGNDAIHITWSNNSGPGQDRTFEYVRLSSVGSTLAVKHGAGGDAILGSSTGFMALRFFNVSGPSVPSYGPLCLLFYDNTGAIVKNLTVGYHQRTFEQASLVRNATGSTFVFYMMNNTVMNLTSVQGTTLGLNQSVLLSGRSQMTSPRISLDDEGSLQLLWIDRIPNPGYDYAGIYHMRLNPNGTLLRPATYLAGLERAAYLPKELALLDTKGFADIPVIARGGYTDMGSGGDEMPDSYLFIELQNDGTVDNSTKVFMSYCSDNTPAMTQGGHGLFFMFWGERACWSEMGGGTTKKDENLFFMRSMANVSIDLAVSRSDITFPDRIFPDEQFIINVTVHNKGDWYTKDFTLNVTDKSTSALLASGTRYLGLGEKYTFSFPLNLHKHTTFLVEVDPLTNHDVNMSNNMVEVPLTPIGRPDLAIFTDNITFSNIRPNKGEVLELSALISNLGGLDAGAEVLFFDGIKGPLIGKTAVHFNTTFSTTSIFWAPANIDVRTIVVKITNVTPSELPGHSGNNEANRTILVGSPTVPSVQIVDPAKGAKVQIGQINITGRAWDIDGDALQVFVRVDGGPWEQAATSLNSTITGVDWFILWDLSDIAEGNHTIGAQVKDDIHENETLSHIVLVKYLVPFTILSWSPAKDPTINETQSQLFEVQVGNPHGLNISYEWTLDGEVMNQTSRFNLTTTYDASGTYKIRVNVSFGDLKWNHSWKLTVLDVNRPPVMISHSPQNDSQILRYQTTQSFEVNVTDLDGDALNYTWTTGGKLLNATKGLARISFIKDGDYFVNVTISDGKGGIINHSWKVQVKRIAPPCCTPPPKTHTYLEDMFLVGILVIGGIIIVLLAIIYVRYNRLIKGKKGKGDTELGESPTENDLSPAGHVR
jgi:hypothetical protein